MHCFSATPAVAGEIRSKPIREEVFPSKLVFEKTDFSFIDSVVDPDREKRSGPKGYLPSSIFMALLLMYIKSMGSILELIRFLKSNPEWLVILNLRRNVDGKMQYMIPDNSTFSKFAKRLGQKKILEIFMHIVIELMQTGIIKGEKVSLDCSIIRAWFKDCKYANSPEHNDRKCKRHKKRDRDASWTWDHHREQYVYGYKVHIMIDSASGLPIMLTVTKAGYGENRTVPWFVKMLLALGPSVKKLLADAAYDGNKTRLMIVKKLKAIPFIPLNTRNCKGKNEEEKRARRKMLCLKFYAKNFIKQYWVDPDSEIFDEEYDARTFSEQGFSVGKGSLNLDSLKCKGLDRAALHSACICIVMLLVAKTAVEIGRPDLMRCIKCFQG
jgi:IS5 family transposase